MAGKVELVIRFHPVGGDDVSLLSADFSGQEEALEAVARALDERSSLVLKHAKEGPDTNEHGVVLNLANVVSVRVSKTDGETTGPYV
ncbi:hypothetical protein HC028_14470 [Planosporangium flavigriseum]|uniref:Uncharacterized protein n=1 Tax=Planosporangium flavigriseum TaxID=373681 RepID=A0A8J3LLK0_9ACTN|nr:hypothetical protein [Planosporangium flavigriseum]NJC65694.1 hypothetical protein [Planosporangium flavigriseum]GIG73544.1 hypothetical protein Pfl04_19480 [Planosporangium flavigriseum]